MSKAKKLLEDLSTDDSANPMQEFSYYSNEMFDNLSRMYKVLEDAKLDGAHPYNQLLKDLSAKSDEILKKVSNFIDQAQARKKEIKPKKDLEIQQDSKV